MKTCPKNDEPSTDKHLDSYQYYAKKPKTQRTQEQEHRETQVIDCGDFFFSVFLTRLKFTALLVHAQP